MCLIISVLLGALGINFFLNGFYMQAVIMFVLSLTLVGFMIKNRSCLKTGCGLKQGDANNTNSSLNKETKL